MGLVKEPRTLFHGLIKGLLYISKEEMKFRFVMGEGMFSSLLFVCYAKAAQPLGTRCTNHQEADVQPIRSEQDRPETP